MDRLRDAFTGTEPPAPATADEERADRLEMERAHAEGEHQHCDITCPIQMPSESMRTTILYRAIPGSESMLDELLRRARTEVAAPSTPAHAELCERIAEVRRIVMRLIAHATGFQDVLDESDRDPWARLVRADIDALRTATAVLPAPGDRLTVGAVPITCPGADEAQETEAGRG